ncbi:MAG: GNAT family N-acetyltransferase [Desulfobacula sp.]|nr:GNAT family N-acetyltransferase [Desulfobacula sp.]
MLKISVLTPNYSAVYAKEFELTVLFNSLVKMMLTNLLSLVIDLVKVKNATLELYQKKSVIKNDQVLLIKEAQENEAGELIRYVYKIRQDSSFLSVDEGIDNISVDNEKKHIRKCRNSEHNELLIGWLQDEVVGYLAFRSNMWQRLRSAGEFAFSVSKKNWGLGIGSHIMVALLDWARKSKVIKTIEFRVRSDNKRAIAVYRKLGFTPKRPLLWGPFDYIVMKRTLP